LDQKQSEEVKPSGTSPLAWQPIPGALEVREWKARRELCITTLKKPAFCNLPTQWLLSLFPPNMEVDVESDHYWTLQWRVWY